MDLTYLYVGDGRRLFALWEDGTLLPVARGGQEAGDGGEGDGSGEDEGASGSGDGAGEGADSGAAGDKSGDKADGAKTVQMTQAELDDLIKKRVDKATKAAADQAKQQADRAKMDEAERLKAEKTDAEAAAKAATEKANTRLVHSDAKVAAVAAGVAADRVDRFMRLVDLGDVEVDDDGNVDAKAVKKAVDAALKDVPEFKAQSGDGKGRSGGEMNGNGDNKKATTLEDAVAARYAS